MAKGTGIGYWHDLGQDFADGDYDDADESLEIALVDPVVKAVWDTLTPEQQESAAVAFENGWFEGQW